MYVVINTILGLGGHVATYNSILGGHLICQCLTTSSIGHFKATLDH